MIGILIFFGLIILFSAIRVVRKNKKLIRLNLLRSDYETALRGYDKREALNKGRIYFAAMRKNNRLTLFDEQSITNDINTMK